MSDLDPNTLAWLDSFARQALAGLGRGDGLSPRATEVLRDAMRTLERYPVGKAVSNSAEPRVKWILSGWAGEIHALPDGRRQICALFLPGDVLVSRPPPAKRGGRFVAALTRLDCVDLMRAVEGADPEVRGEVMKLAARSLQANDERRYVAIVRLGRQLALERIASLMLELKARLDAIGQSPGDGFRLPLTQDDIADVLGLSMVHVNRTLRHLREEGILDVRFGWVSIHDAGRLLEVASGLPLGEPDPDSTPPQATPHPEQRGEH